MVDKMGLIFKSEEEKKEIKEHEKEMEWVRKNCNFINSDNMCLLTLHYLPSGRCSGKDCIFMKMLMRDKQ